MPTASEQHAIEIQQALLAIFTAILNDELDMAVDIIYEFDHAECLSVALAQYATMGVLKANEGSVEDALEVIQEAGLKLMALEG